jgi:hypothetical protein
MATGPTLAADIKDWLTVAAILAAGGWAVWRFYHQEWLRWRSEVPALEGSNPPREIVCQDDKTCIVSLRWTWRNAGNRPLYVNVGACKVEIYRIPDGHYGVIDPRQQAEALGPPAFTHHPLADFSPYMFEPGTTSTLLTPVALPADHSYIARMVLVSDRSKHRVDGELCLSWERWQVFRTDMPCPVPAS